MSGKATVLSLWRRLVTGSPIDSFDEVLLQFDAGTITLPVALMELVYLTADPADLERRLARSRSSRIGQVRAFARKYPGAHSIVARAQAARTTRAEGTDEKAYWSAEYDRLVAVSPAASVALCSFGDEALLDAMSSEVVERLEVLDLIGPSVRVLDYGCGIGRVTARLAPLVATVAGTDISTAMLAEAEARCAGLENVRLVSTRDSEVRRAGEIFDLILMIGVLDHVEEPLSLLRSLSRQLSDGGSLFILDWSRAGGFDTPRALLDELARSEGLRQIPRDRSCFVLSTGDVFQLQRSRQARTRRRQR